MIPRIDSTFRRASLAAVAVALAAGSASAQVTVADPESGRFMSTWWLFWLILYCVAWVGVYDWVGRDAERCPFAKAQHPKARENRDVRVLADHDGDTRSTVQAVPSPW